MIFFLEKKAEENYYKLLHNEIAGFFLESPSFLGTFLSVARRVSFFLFEVVLLLLLLDGMEWGCVVFRRLARVMDAGTG